jgi:hypothetical protein
MCKYLIGIRETIYFFCLRAPKLSIPASSNSSVRGTSSQSHTHYKHLQFYPERKCELGMGKTYTQFYRKWAEVKNKLY